MINNFLYIAISLCLITAFNSCCKEDDKPEIIEASCNVSFPNIKIDYTLGYNYDTNRIPGYCRLIDVLILDKCETRLNMTVDPLSTGSQYAILRKLAIAEVFDTLYVVKVPAPIVPKDSVLGFLDKSVNNEKYKYTYMFLEVEPDLGITCESNSMNSR